MSRSNFRWSRNIISNNRLIFPFSSRKGWHMIKKNTQIACYCLFFTKIINKQINNREAIYNNTKREEPHSISMVFKNDNFSY